jgi:hypothetical protein
MFLSTKHKQYVSILYRINLQAVYRSCLYTVIQIINKLLRYITPITTPILCATLQQLA